MLTTKPSVLIAGASTGIGATYADRFARRGHDLVLVARDKVRMEALADRLRRETGVKVEIMSPQTFPPPFAGTLWRLRRRVLTNSFENEMPRIFGQQVQPLSEEKTYE